MAHSATPTVRRVLTTISALAAFLVLAAPAHANYAGGTNVGCTQGYNSAGRDRAGTMYMPCGGAVRIVRADGHETTATINVGVSRLAPSPDGRYLYSIDGTGPMRFVRGADGNYRRDAFQFQLPAGWAARGWKLCGWGIATDAYGYVYISNGGWCPGNPNMILKYRPAGTLVTGFGEYGSAAYKGHLPGSFKPNMSIAVTHDGSRIWVADQNNFRVQYFDRTADNTTYRHAGMWSGEGTAWDGQMGAVYGVALDPWGYAYVTQTTTKVIWRLAPNGTTPVLVANRSANAAARRPHTLAVDARGHVWVGEWGQRLARTTAVPGPLPALPPEPRPDAQAPVVTSIAAPTETTAQVVRVTVRATDDIGVTQMRFADENGRWGAWRAWQATSDVTLTSGYGTKLIYVQVRDAAGRESGTARATVLRRQHMDDRAPVIASIAVPEATTEGSVRVAVTATDDVGVTQMRLADERGEWAAWRRFEPSFDVALTEGYGTKAVYVQVRDAVGRESNVLSRLVARNPVPDISEPTVVLRAPSMSTTEAVSLEIDAADDIGVTHLRVAGEDGEFSEWRAWSSGTAVLSHSTSAGYGTKLVAVQVRDAAFKVSATAQATIVVAAPARAGDAGEAAQVVAGGPVTRDRVAPRLLRLRVPARSCSRRVVLRQVARDDVRVRSVRIANETGRYGRWRAYSPRMVHFLTKGDTRKLVTVQVRDAAGNVSRAVSRRTMKVSCSR